LKKALITGVTGQDGSYLAELLLKKGYAVHGIKRRSSLFNTDRIDHIYADPHEEQVRFQLHHGDLSDATNLIRVIQDVQPDEIYNLAAMSHVHVSFETPEYTGNVDGLGTLRLLEAIRILNMTDRVKIYHASTSELFGKVQAVPQDETTPFYPRSPYGAAKIYAYWITRNYREAYNMFASNGILFNHESPRRGETFVTRKITRAVAEISLGRQETLFLGNIDAERDWGHAKDYVEAMWRILQAGTPDDFVVATGVKHSVRKFVVASFAHVGIEIEFSGSAQEEVGHIVSFDEARFAKATGGLAPSDASLKTGSVVMRIDPYYYRPTEVDELLGNPAKIKRELGWKPSTSFEELVEEMMEADLLLFRKRLHSDQVS